MTVKCNQCPRQCNAVRTATENTGGFCRMPANPKIARADLHFWEEPCISGKNGSGTIFFSGCSLRCVYCQNYEISHKDKGEIITTKRLAEFFYELEQKGAHNINFVNPTHYYDSIKKALKIYKPNIPLVYNSSGYDLSEKIDENLFDIYLFDLKYISGDNSLKYSGTADYFNFASASIKTAYKNVPEPLFNDDGTLKEGVIVRHLILPSATKEAIKVIDWFCNNTPNAILSLMSQYIPMGVADRYPEINRKITPREYNKVIDYAADKDIEHIYIQQMSSAKEEYIPNFNFGG